MEWDRRTDSTFGATSQSDGRPASRATDPPETKNWYAVQTRIRHEKAVSDRLGSHGITTFLPLVNEMHRWKDRKKKVEVPLFGSYLFVSLLGKPEEFSRVRRVAGVVHLLGYQGIPTPIPEMQVETVRTVLACSVPCYPYPFLKSGQPVRIRGGALDGLEGIFVSRSGDDTVVLSVSAIQRSLAVRVSGYDVEAI
jgi:transcription antitermination factor NusG